jgi:hypothetical protein
MRGDAIDGVQVKSGGHRDALPGLDSLQGALQTVH